MLADELIMVELLGNSQLQQELFTCNAASLLRATEANAVKICILLAHYYFSICWEYLRSSTVSQKSQDRPNIIILYVPYCAIALSHPSCLHILLRNWEMSAEIYWNVQT